MSQGQQIYQNQLCEHVLEPASTSIDLVLDGYLQPCDALMSCKLCDVRLLLELCDIDQPEWCYRLSLIGKDLYQSTLRSLGKGSCDLHRAQNELLSLHQQAIPLCQLLVRKDGLNHQLLTIPQDESIPSSSWRDLPCDGGLIRRVRTQQL